ncbi:MAG: TAXI family TRAP transporter solute-binding subunit [Chloroflexi bacterium]|nr:TAXI family TRAP transporter solute-binding subunit [Chloroflexota bacterium]
MSLRKLFLIGMAGVLTISIVAACSKSSSPTTSSSPSKTSSSTQSTSSASKQLTRLRMGTVAVGTSAYTVGSTIAALSNKYNPDINISVTSESAEAEAVRIMGTGEAQIALGSPRLFWQGANAQGPFKDQKPIPGINVLWWGWGSHFHFIVPAKSSIKSLADLKGKRIGVNNVGTTAYNDARSIATVAGLDIEKDVKWYPGSDSVLVGALKDGNIDAIIRPLGIGAAAFTEAFRSQELKLLPIPRDIFDKFLALTKEPAAFFFFGSFPKGSYPGQDSEVPTFGYIGGYGIRSDVPEDVVYKITKANWTHLDEAAQTSALNTQWKGLLDVPIDATTPRHPGAVKALKELNLLK